MRPICVRVRHGQRLFEKRNVPVACYNPARIACGQRGRYNNATTAENMHRKLHCVPFFRCAVCQDCVYCRLDLCHIVCAIIRHDNGRYAVFKRKPEVFLAKHKRAVVGFKVLAAASVGASVLCTEVSTGHPHPVTRTN